MHGVFTLSAERVERIDVGGINSLFHAEKLKPHLPAEARAAVIAAQENCDLPIFATMTFEEDGRTFLGTSPEIAASILPKSVTTPIAMAVGGSIGGIPAISAVCVIFVGILGAVFGHTLLNAMRIRTKAARGLAMGTASHALGTARCAELDYQEGAFSSLALVLCGIITSLIAPFLFPIILAVMG